MGLYSWSTYRCASTNLLALAAKPLPFGYEWYPVAFLVHSQIAAVTKGDGIGIFAVAIVTDGAFAIGFVARARRLAVDGRCRARSGSVSLRMSRIGFWYAWQMSAGSSVC